MTAKRRADFSIEEALVDPGFTPRRADLEAIVALVPEADDARLKAITRAILRSDDEGLAHIDTLMRERDRDPKPNKESVALWVRALSELAARGKGALARERASAGLGSANALTRARFAKLIGKLASSEGADIRAEGRRSLEAARATELDDRAREAIETSLVLLGARIDSPKHHATPKGDGNAKAPTTDKSRDRIRAELIRDREALRSKPSTIAIDSKLGPLTRGRGARVVWEAREGLEDVVLRQIGDAKSTDVVALEASPGRVEGRLFSGLRALFAGRSALRAGLVIEHARKPACDDATAVLDALASNEARAMLETLTAGPARVRLEWSDRGKQRATTWKISEELAKRTSSKITIDSREATWDAVVSFVESAVRLELFPNVDDPRFKYRRGDVPAASHPTIAAALAYVGGVRDDDVVWDPFVGSALELCERSLLGPSVELIGTDIDDDALAVAQTNLDAAGAKNARLLKADAREGPPRAPSLIVTNPPMGRRVLRGDDVVTLLSDVVATGARALRDDGRIVMLSPCPRETREAAKSAGLTQTLERRVDLGGFSVDLQRFERVDSANPSGRDDVAIRSRAGRGNATRRR